MSLKKSAHVFNTEIAPALARSGRRDHDRGPVDPTLAKSTRFAYFEDSARERLVIVAGDQEKGDVELAFAYGLGYREGRRLVLVLPRSHSFATLQRAPWFTDDARPEILAAPRRSSPAAAAAHPRPKRSTPSPEPSKGNRPSRNCAPPPRRYTSGTALTPWPSSSEGPPPTPDSTRVTAKTGGPGSAWDNACSRSAASGHGTDHGIAITAGIHYSKPGQAPAPVTVEKGAILTAEQLETLWQAVETGIGARLDGSKPIHHPDEHWLQAVIRRDPSLVGVEQPALRELPAWRPHDSPSRWGRGFIDLIGVDGHGDIRIVETKLAHNPDDRLILQGLDYYLWANAYREAVVNRLGAAKKARLEIHYVIGDTVDGAIKVSGFAAAQAAGLDKTIPWRFHTVRGWYHPPNGTGRARTGLLPPGNLP